MFNETLNYIIFQNPVSEAAFSVIANSAKVISRSAEFMIPKQQPVQQIIKMDPEPLWKLAGKGGFFVRMAGVSGAAAVILGAYGAHSVLPDKEKDEKAKMAFETANRYHFFHSLALLGVPLCRYPALSGSLFVLGLSLFSGTCYYFALTGDKKFSRLTPIGGTCLILGWIAMVL